MPLETATFINQLDIANPASTDQVAQADEHLRLIKSTLRSTFPNIDGPVTVDQDVLNSIPSILPIGLITIWYGSNLTVPAGWAICDGSTVSRTDGAGTITTPDLTDRVVVGAGSLIANQGVTAGAAIVTGTTGASGSHSHTITGGEHTHTGAVLGTALTEAQMPAHTHRAFSNVVRDVDITSEPDGYLAWSNGNSPGEEEIEMASAGSTAPTLGRVQIVGSGASHNHGLTIDSATHTHAVSSVSDHTHSFATTTIQPCMGLHYIMKV